MSSSCYQRLSTILVLLTITLPTFQQAWQSSGNMSESNITEIHNQIESNQITSTNTKAQINLIAKTISTQLNQLWDPAWNVVIVKSYEQDTILYGYAFRGHWVWINGIGFPTIKDYTFTYIIWKDYNCQQWRLISDLTAAGSGFTSNQLSQINSYTFTKVYQNIWLEAHDFVEYVNVKSTLSTGAYSVIMGKSPFNEYHGHICLVNTNFLAKQFIQKTSMVDFGSYFLFQTR